VWRSWRFLRLPVGGALLIEFPDIASSLPETTIR
jgi:hypothetical protein